MRWRWTLNTSDDKLVKHHPPNTVYVAAGGDVPRNSLAWNNFFSMDSQCRSCECCVSLWCVELVTSAAGLDYRVHLKNSSHLYTQKLVKINIRMARSLSRYELEWTASESERTACSGALDYRAGSAIKRHYAFCNDKVRLLYVSNEYKQRIW